MSTVAQMLNRWETLDMQQQITTAVEKTSQEYVNMNTNQLLKGKDADGKDLPGYKSEAYAEYKHSLNSLPPFGVPDYKLTGAMYRNMKLQVRGDIIEVFSTVSYWSDLVDRGGNFTGLNDESKPTYTKTILQPVLVRQMKDWTGTY